MDTRNVIETCEGRARPIFNMPDDHENTPIKNIEKEIIPLVRNM